MIAQRPTLLRAWWPTALWIGLIAFESTDYLSSDHTGSLLYSLLTHLFGQINLYDFLVWHHYLRKTGHVLGYGILCLLFLRGWRATLASRTSQWLAALSAWAGTAVIALLDEWHQTFLPSRTGTFRDVILDSAAAFAFLVIAQIWLRRSRHATLPQAFSSRALK